MTNPMAMTVTPAVLMTKFKSFWPKWGEKLTAADIIHIVAGMMMKRRQKNFLR
jgi:hypothetical protein